MKHDPRDAVGRRTWNRHWEFQKGRLKTSISPYRVPALHRLLLRFMPKTPGVKVIEIGASPGRFMVYFAEQFGCEVTGIEYSPAGYALMLRTLAQAGITAQCHLGDVFTYEFPEGSLDVVFSAGFLEHFENRTTVLARMDALLKPGGLLVVTWPNLLGLNGRIFRLTRPTGVRTHHVFHAGEIRQRLEKWGYAPLYAGPMNGPFLMHPWGEVRCLKNQATLRLLMAGPFLVLNRLLQLLNFYVVSLPESDLLSSTQGVIARKGRS